MKLLIEQGNVVCTLENKNHDFLHDCYPRFTSYQGDKLKMHESGIESDYARLKTIVGYAERHGVEVSEEVRERLSQLKQRAEEAEEKRYLEEERRKKQRHWEELKKNGCGRCEHCRATGFEDEYICEAANCELEVENRSVYDYKRQINYLFVLTPMPTKECPYNTERRVENA